MLKEIQGRKFMTGTGAKSLYPVVMTHANGLQVGVKFQIGKTQNPGLFAVQLYIRVQKFDDQGNDVSPTVEEVFEALPNITLRFASKFHVSGPLVQGAFNGAKGDQSANGMAAKFGDFFADAIIRTAESLKSGLVAIPADELKALGAERYAVEVLGDFDDDKVTEQMDIVGDKFDFKSMLSKPGASDPK